MEALSFGLTYAIPAFGAAIAIGLIGKGALSALARNPEKMSDIRSLMTTAIVFVESIAILAIITAILSKIF